jgi:hypothetical protein
MWTCPRCGRSFANRNQQHACGPLDLDRHLAGRDPEVVAIFERLVELAERNGPVTVLPERTRIAFQVRMSFAAFSLRRRWVDGHVVLARRLEHPRFRKVETFSPRNHLHQFRLERLEEVDEEVAAWLAEAYRVGEQRHLAP